MMIAIIRNNLSFFIAASVAVAFVYLSGYFLFIGFSMLYMLSYSDILISIMYMMPVLALVLTGYQALRDWTDGLYAYSRPVNILIGLGLIVVGTASYWYFGNMSTIGALLCFFIAFKKPFSDYLASILNGFSDDDISNTYLVLFVFAAAFGQGIADFQNTLMARENIKIVDVDGYKNCKLIGVFSQVLFVAGADEKSFQVVPNTNEFAVRLEQDEKAVSCKGDRLAK